MTKRVVEHKIKLEKSVKIILGVLAFGVCLNAFAPAFSVKEAFADFSELWGTEVRPIAIKFELDCKGCN